MVVAAGRRDDAQVATSKTLETPIAIATPEISIRFLATMAAFVLASERHPEPCTDAFVEAHDFVADVQ